MKYFLDTEFFETELSIRQIGVIPTIDLISIGIVDEDGREFYKLNNEHKLDYSWENDWLKKNVFKQIYNEIIPNFDHDKNFIFDEETLKLLFSVFGSTRKEIVEEILSFVGKDKTPKFYGYYADYDWVVFAQLFGRMTDLPKGWPMYCVDLRQMMDQNGLTRKWKEKNCPDPLMEHSALEDARWNRELYNQICIFNDRNNVN
jgi:hypothetical protein